MKELKQTSRNSNLELLRILAMLMIISFHIVFHVVVSTQFPNLGGGI